MTSTELDAPATIRVYLVPDGQNKRKTYYLEGVVDIEISEHFITFMNGYTVPTLMLNKNEFSHFLLLGIEEELEEHDEGDDADKT